METNLKIVKNELSENSNSEIKDPGTEEFLDSDSIFIVQIKNHDGKIGYMGVQNNRPVIISKICHFVKKFKNFDEAKKFGNTLVGVEKTVIGKNKIAKLIAEQEGGVTIPVDKVEGEMYHVVVRDKNTNEIVGYITYKPETDEYSVIKGMENAAFWESEERAVTFIEAATKTFFSKHDDLILDKVKYK